MAKKEIMSYSKWKSNKKTDNAAKKKAKKPKPSAIGPFLENAKPKPKPKPVVNKYPPGWNMNKYVPKG